MATKTYDEGAGTGALGTAANWDADTLPSAGDDLRIQQGYQDLTGDLSALGNMLSLLVTSGWKGRQIGTAATPVKLYVSSGGNGDAVIQGSANLELVNLSATGGTITRFRASYARSLTCDGGTWSAVEIGNVTSSIWGQNTTLGEMRLLGGKHLIDTGGTTGPTLLIVGPGAELRIRRQCPDYTNVFVFGTLIVEDGGGLGTVANSKVYVAPGGYLNNRSSTQLPPVEIITGGTVNALGAQKDTSYGTLRDWPNSTFEERPVGVLATVSTRKPVIKR